MGEFHQKAKGLDNPQAPEMVTVTMTLSKAAWAGLKMVAELRHHQHVIAKGAYQAIEQAVVVPAAGPGAMMNDIARVVAITVTLRRPLITISGNEDGFVDGAPIPVGATFTLTVNDRILYCPGGPDQEFPDAGYIHADDVLDSAAEVPCERLSHDSCDCGDGYPCGHGDWFCCERGNDEDMSVCLGDKCQCPRDEVRAEAVLEQGKVDSDA